MAAVAKKESEIESLHGAAQDGARMPGGGSSEGHFLILSRVGSPNEGIEWRVEWMTSEGEMIRKWERKFSQKRKRARDTASFPAAVRREKKREGREGKTEREKAVNGHLS